MPSNPIGPGTKNLTVNVPADLHAALSDLARKSGKKLGAYVRKVLEEAVQQHVVYREIRDVGGRDYDGTLMVAEDPPPKPASKSKPKRSAKRR